MASVLSDQFIPGSVITPLALTTTTAFPQFNPASLNGKSVGRTGNASLILPNPALYSSGGSGARRYRVNVTGVARAAISSSISFVPTVTDTAGSAFNLGSVGSLTINNQTLAFSISFEFILDPAAPVAGYRIGYFGPTLIAVTATTAASPVYTGSLPFLFSMSASIVAADATALLTIREMTVELL